MQRFVYFDLGNVLVLFDHQIAIDQLSKLTGRSPSQVYDCILETQVQTRFETGLISQREYTDEINNSLDSNLSVAEVMEAISAIFQPNQPILKVLDKLDRLGVPLGILSNTCDAHWNWIGAKQWPMVARKFQPQILSYEVGSMKPDSGIYEAAERAVGLKEGAIFFTDDRADNIAAAKKRGWMAHQFQDVDLLERAVDNWLAS